jgi:hypothetical protein
MSEGCLRHPTAYPRVDRHVAWVHTCREVDVCVHMQVCRNAWICIHTYVCEHTGRCICVYVLHTCVDVCLYVSLFICSNFLKISSPAAQRGSVGEHWQMADAFDHSQRGTELWGSWSVGGAGFPGSSTGGDGGH